MLKSAKLEEGLLNGALPPELLSQLDSLNHEDLAKLLSAIQFNKSNLGKSITNLAKLRMIDPKNLSQCKSAGSCPNPNALAMYMSQCTNASNCDSFAMLAIFMCNSIKPGGPGAPMTWQRDAPIDGAKFKEDVLPPSTRLSDSQFVGVSRTAPELSGENVVAEHGALANAQGSGGAANAQVVLPRHKQAVQRLFKRDL